jgi:hypothetical protein
VGQNKRLYGVCCGVFRDMTSETVLAHFIQDLDGRVQLEDVRCTFSPMGCTTSDFFQIGK